MQDVLAYGASTPKSPLEPLKILRRDVGAHDVEIDILYCGVCHSDLHTARGEWGNTNFPIVPGHEIVGRVSSVGGHVKDFTVGQNVAVGVMVDSCQHCASCDEGLEQYCESGFVETYGAPDPTHGGYTQGGYAKRVVVSENFVFAVPSNLPLNAVSPLLCAGITTYSPLKHWNAGPGKKVGVVGIGGLGHMAVKFAAAMGAEVTVFTTSEAKRAEAHKLGATHVVLSKSATEMQTAAKTLDLIINTVAAEHNLNPYLSALRRDGTLVLLGIPEHAHPSPSVGKLVGGRKSIAGSTIGGTVETREMLEFCSKHNIVSDIEIININDINTAYERMLKGDVHYRFVIDMSTL